MSEPILKLKGFKDKDIPQVWNQLEANLWAMKISLSAEIVNANGWVPLNRWEWDVAAGTNESDGIPIEENEWTGNFKLGKGKLEMYTDFNPSNHDGTHIKVGGRARNLTECWIKFVAFREFEKDGQIETFHTKLFWGQGYENEFDDDDDPEIECADCSKYIDEIITLKGELYVQELINEDLRDEKKDVNVIKLGKAYINAIKTSIKLLGEKASVWNILNAVGVTLPVVVPLLIWIL